MSQEIRPTALYVDYGQAAARAENAAVSRVSKILGVDLYRVKHRGVNYGPGEIRGRNAYLLHTALMEFPGSSGVVMLGIHAGTGYADCGPDFVELMQRSYEFHTQGAIHVAAPFVDWSKEEVFRLAEELGVPVERTHSCEAGDTACGSCRSCRDRQVLMRA